MVVVPRSQSKELRWGEGRLVGMWVYMDHSNIISRGEVYRPKLDRSIGIRMNEEDIDKTSITKLEWRILINSDSIWLRVMREKYIKNNQDP